MGDREMGGEIRVLIQGREEGDLTWRGLVWEKVIGDGLGVRGP